LTSSHDRLFELGNCGKTRTQAGPPNGRVQPLCGAAPGARACWAV